MISSGIHFIELYIVTLDEEGELHLCEKAHLLYIELSGTYDSDSSVSRSSMNEAVDKIGRALKIIE
jgi:hypothetical protein